MTTRSLAMGWTRRTLLTAAGAAFAAPSILRAHSETWVMAGMQDFAPYNYVENGKLIGADIDILTAAAARLRIEMRFVPLPWRRALLAPGRGEADGLFQLTPTAERFRTWLMTGPLRTTGIVFIVLADSPLRDFTNLDDLTGLSVGVVNGFSYSPAFDGASNFHHEGSIDNETSLRKLLLGRADVILGGAANFYYAIEQLDVADRIRVLPTPLDIQGRYVGFTRTPAGQDKSERLGHVLTLMHTEGQISSILREQHIP